MPDSLLRSGPFGVGLLRPTALFGLSGMDTVSQATFWSLLVNVGLYVTVSLLTQPRLAEQSQAVLFTRGLSSPEPGASRWPGRVSVDELRTLTERFFGAAGARKALRDRGLTLPLSPPQDTAASPELIQSVQTLLAGSVGAASARLLVGSVIEEEQVGPGKLIAILDEASQVAASEERQRLARELHDSISQALFSMTLHTRALELAVRREGIDTNGPVGQNLAELRNLTQDALTEMRALIFQLRPAALHEEGLAAAVRRHAAAVSAQEGLEVNVDAPGDRLPLSARAEEELFRLTQEAVRNTVKHAAAGRVDIRLTEDPEAAGTLIVEIADDGVGFAPDARYPGHLGLHSMRERAERLGGRLAIASRPGATTVRAVLPGILPPPAPNGPGAQVGPATER